MYPKKHGLLKIFGFKSIQSSIAVAFSCLIVITIFVMSVLSYNIVEDIVGSNSRDYSYQLIEQVNTNIESYITYMENISQMVLENYDVREYLGSSGTPKSTPDDILEQRISGYFRSIINARSDISSIMVFGTNGNFISNRRNIKLNSSNKPENQDWYKKAVGAGGKPVISSSHVQNVIENEYRWVVTLSRELSENNGENRLGVFLVDLNYSVINNMCNKIELGEKGYIFIIDRNGNIVYHPQQQLIYSNTKTEMIDQVLKSTSSNFIAGEGKERKMYTIKESANTGWKIIGVNYADELVSNKKEIQKFFLTGGLGFFLITILLSLFISSRISRPVKTLEASMKKAEKGDFDIKVNIENANEIGELSKTFNIMIEKIKELMLQNNKEQELKRKNELKALQAQINPHFLYNTLDSIVWMAESKKSEEVVLMTSALAKLFRTSISKGEEVISINNEIEHIKNYLIIQKIRYKNKLDFEIDVEDEIMHYKVLKIILQPLAENSIYHGIKNKDGIGIITIKGRKIQDKILLQVIDNGTGMTPAEIDKVFNKKGRQSGSGIGVYNVNQRIKLYFGDEYGLSYESELDKGTIVSVWLPVLE